MSGHNKGHFFGVVTAGERGQIVIPQEAREDLNIKPKDKLVVFGGRRHKMLVVMQADTMNGFLTRHLDKMEPLRQALEEEPEEESSE